MIYWFPSQHPGTGGIFGSFLLHVLVCIMCRLVAGEDDSGGEVDHHQSTVNENVRMDPQIQMQIARLEARISRVEARMERLEVSVLYMQRRMYLYGFVCLISVLYAIFK
ncbi:hypothetical protein Ccrd_023160 [Cynara cardunculus var. scolymus]|uniref:Uncharacterized protein n=1 Tax=Cynara cardunculus var. scolymus TaxID=59895 RepID=A0A103XXG1_CYNCS|nr:hypothetical protein Ccrd_023160 [Cynara cardunculus var. scolymus]